MVGEQLSSFPGKSGNVTHTIGILGMGSEGEVAVTFDPQ